MGKVGIWDALYAEVFEGCNDAEQQLIKIKSIRLTLDWFEGEIAGKKGPVEYFQKVALARVGGDGERPRDLRKYLCRRLKLPGAVVDKRLADMREAGMIDLVSIPQPQGRVGAPNKRYVLPF